MIYRATVTFEINTILNDYDDQQCRALIQEQCENSAESGTCGAGISDEWKERIVSVSVARRA